MRAFLWTLGAVAVAVVVGAASIGLQEMANAQTNAKPPAARVNNVKPTAANGAAKQDNTMQVAAVPPPSAQNAAPEWGSRCASNNRQSAPECFMEQTAVLTKTGQLVASMTIRLPASSKQPVMMVQLPVGLYLPAGIVIKIDDGAPMRLVVQTCDLKGCYAGEQISAELLTAMKSGKQLAIVFQDLAKKDITVPLTLARFAEAYERIQ
jgi:invasion protein IalB